MKTIKTISALALVAALSIIAFASVSFDESTGTGFVGKGDIQLLFGWNNKQLQNNAGSLSFAYNTTDHYDVGCYWETVTGKGKIIVHDITVSKNVSVNSSVAFDARVKNQITGFNLNGWGSVTTNGTTPVVGDPCPGNGNEGLIDEVTLTKTTGDGLTVNGQPLPNTPVL